MTMSELSQFRFMDFIHTPHWTVAVRQCANNDDAGLTALG